MPRLLRELAVGRGDGSYTRLLARLAKLDLLAIDDWMLAPLRDAERRDLTEVIEDRAERASTLIASQFLVTDWHAVIGDPNQADAICDRLLHDAHRIELKGHSMRRTHDAPKTRNRKKTRPRQAGPWIAPVPWKTRSRRSRLTAPSCRRVFHSPLDGEERRPYAPQARSRLVTLEERRTAPMGGN